MAPADHHRDEILTDNFHPVRKAVEDRDWAASDGHFTRMVVKANHYHDVFDKGFIQWKRPDIPPPDLDLTPRG